MYIYVNSPQNVTHFKLKSIPIQIRLMVCIIYRSPKPTTSEAWFSHMDIHCQKNNGFHGYKVLLILSLKGLSHDMYGLCCYISFESSCFNQMTD